MKIIRKSSIKKKSSISEWLNKGGWFTKQRNTKQRNIAPINESIDVLNPNGMGKTENNFENLLKNPANETIEGLSPREMDETRNDFDNSFKQQDSSKANIYIGGNTPLAQISNEDAISILDEATILDIGEIENNGVPIRIFDISAYDFISSAEEAGVDISRFKYMIDILLQKNPNLTISIGLPD